MSEPTLEEIDPDMPDELRAPPTKEQLNKQKVRPAFPTLGAGGVDAHGLSAREYAAIHVRLDNISMTYAHWCPNDPAPSINDLLAYEAWSLRCQVACRLAFADELLKQTRG